MYLPCLFIIQVTGSGRGIGRYLCLELATSGATIVCWSKSPGPNEEVVREIRKRGGKAHSYSLDVSDRNAVAAAANMVSLNIQIAQNDFLITNSLDERILVSLRQLVRFEGKLEILPLL